MNTFLLLASLVIFFLLPEQVGIGTNSPHASAQRELNSTKKGLLVSKLALTAANVAAPVVPTAIALLVYNTATAGIAQQICQPKAQHSW